jgi:hypothetical protein
MVETYTASGCGTDNATLYMSYIAQADGTAYTALPEVVTLGNASTYSATYVFPGFTVTVLTPGEMITLVRHIDLAT